MTAARPTIVRAKAAGAVARSMNACNVPTAASGSVDPAPRRREGCRLRPEPGLLQRPCVRATSQ